MVLAPVLQGLYCLLANKFADSQSNPHNRPKAYELIKANNPGLSSMLRLSERNVKLVWPMPSVSNFDKVNAGLKNQTMYLTASLTSLGLRRRGFSVSAKQDAHWWSSTSVTTRHSSNKLDSVLAAPSVQHSSKTILTLHSAFTVFLVVDKGFSWQGHNLTKEGVGI